ncbi:MAG: rhomboid family intramembrane serine protease [Niastella sp.]|nr:rhomboid family intramembrane serine protease [Niastella sp.]
MVLPIGDDNRDRRITPIVNYLLIIGNILAFIFWQDWGRDLNVSFAYSAIPAEILTNEDVVTNSKILVDPLTGQQVELPGLQRTPIPVFLTLFTSMFMHGGLAHLGGNMLFLWIFGDNIEDALGHMRYLIFYLLCGMLAGLSHVFSTLLLDQNLLIPSLGASGAISAVLGAYIMLYPTRTVHVWIFFIFILPVPALIVVGLWFVFQVLNGLGTLGGEEASGIAYAAHIGGFIVGFLLIRLFTPKRVAISSRRR